MPDHLYDVPPPLAEPSAYGYSTPAEPAAAGAGGAGDHYGGYGYSSPAVPEVAASHYGGYNTPAAAGSVYDDYHDALGGGGAPDLNALMNAHPAAAEAAPGHNVHDPFGLGAGHLTTTPLLDAYRGEERGAQEPGHMPENIGGMATPTTAYASSPDVHRTSVQDGQLVRPGGDVADSSASKRMWSKDKDERMNFAMDGQGSMYLSDPKAEFLALRNERRDAGETTTGRINHSTMVAGGDVAGAGTARVRGGKVETLGDGSGHYQPTVTQTAQVAETLAGKGVMDPARSSIELSGKGAGQKELLMSTQELLSYGDDFSAAKSTFAATGDKSALAAPEATIRGRHALKDNMQAELLNRVGGAGGATGALAQIRSERAPAAAEEPHLYDVAGGYEAPVYDSPYDVIDE